jgi:16S rRNA (guanine527-N7)-methyltransferase
MPDDDELLLTLTEIQRRGAIGAGPLDHQIAHALRFVRALPPPPATVLDLGSGGGLPGLVIAHHRRDLEVILVERRAKRADLLEYGARRLGLASVRVIDDDARNLVASGVLTVPVDVVTARSFGPMEQVLEVAAPLVRPAGVVLVSEAPGQLTPIPGQLLGRLGFVDEGAPEGIRRFRRFHVEPATAG